MFLIKKKEEKETRAVALFHSGEQVYSVCYSVILKKFKTLIGQEYSRSYLARNVSLGLRLAANILSGHMLLNILSGFTYKIITKSKLYILPGFIPLSFIVAFSGLELGIALIQAQVFIVLSSAYIKDGLDLH